MDIGLLDKLLSRPIAFHRVFVELTGEVNSALMLSQAHYWSTRTKDSTGWFYKSSSEWTEETGLTRHQQDTARRRLKDTGFWDEKLEGMPAKCFYRVNKTALFLSLSESGKQEQISDNRQSSLPENGKHSIYPETTTETTFEGSKEPSPQKEIFPSYQDLKNSAIDCQPVALQEKKEKKVARKKKEKEVDPFFPEFVRVWTEAYPEMGFDGVAGKKIKSLISKTKAYLVAGGKDPSTAVQMWAYIIAYMKRGYTWFHGKDLGIIESKFNSLVFEIKNGKQKQQSTKNRTTTDVLNDLRKAGKFN